MNYWENRLKQNYNFVGVGDQSLGEKYNHILYKIRRILFHKVLKQLKLDPSAGILEIGPGTGFYIEEYKRNNFKEVHGIDISETATNKLKLKYLNYHFICADISNEVIGLNKRFDFVFAFDVLFHVVEDSNYKQAFTNIAALTNDKGYFIFSEYQCQSTEVRYNHFVVRKKHFIEECIKSNGFEIIKKFPVFVLFNQPYSTENKIFKKIISIHLALIRKIRLYRMLMGYMLFPLELLLLKIEIFMPSTILWICKKND